MLGLAPDGHHMLPPGIRIKPEDCRRSCRGGLLDSPSFLGQRHVNFRAKKLFGAVGNIVDGAVAYIDLNGGRPTKLHTHEHNHLFIVTEGEARILLGDEELIIHKDEAFLVEGRIPHSCWNNIDGVTKMIGINVV